MDPRYPIGRWERRDELTSAERRTLIDDIAAMPAALRSAIHGLDDAQLDTPYREGGWTLRQVVHHVPDSHLNSYVRFKLALTEENPTIRTYDEASWAALSDSRTTPVSTSLELLESLHGRWVHLLRGMSDADFRRTLEHPENGPMTLDAMVSLYSWHGRHHTGHLTTTRASRGW
jgi:uncharacterized damage-inducible protein DinB